MIIQRRKNRKVPGLNTAALPDLIFTVLFFFMIVTHMRTETSQVNYTIPKGSQLSTVGSKASTINIYVGKPAATKNADYAVQIGDNLVRIEDLNRYIDDTRSMMSAENAEALTIALKIDKDCPMHIVNKIKNELRHANALRISYNATNVKDSIK